MGPEILHGIQSESSATLWWLTGNCKERLKSHSKMSSDSKGAIMGLCSADINTSLRFCWRHTQQKVHLEFWVCRPDSGPTQESIHQAAHASHGPEENLWELLQTWVQDHLVRDAAGAEELLLELGSCAHYRWVAQVHRVTGKRGSISAQIGFRKKSMLMFINASQTL